MDKHGLKHLIPDIFPAIRSKGYQPSRQGQVQVAAQGGLVGAGAGSWDHDKIQQMTDIYCQKKEALPKLIMVNTKLHKIATCFLARGLRN